MTDPLPPEPNWVDITHMLPGPIPPGPSLDPTELTIGDFADYYQPTKAEQDAGIKPGKHGYWLRDRITLEHDDRPLPTRPDPGITERNPDAWSWRHLWRWLRH